MNLITKLTEFVGGNLFKEVKSVINEYWPPDVSPEKRAEFEMRMQELEARKVNEAGILANEEMRITSDDRKNARLENKTSNMPQILSLMLTAFIVAIVYLLFYVGVPPASRDTLILVLGIVIKEWGGSMQYWFGTTKSSQEKNKLLANAEPAKD